MSSPSDLFHRALGSLSPRAIVATETSHLLRAISAAKNVKFDGSKAANSAARVSSSREAAGAYAGTEENTQSADAAPVWAHKTGVNCLAIEKFDGRFMLSGGAASSIFLWDLDTAGENGQVPYKPRARITPDVASNAHKFGITHLSFYPFDAGAFLSSSYDHTLKIYATETMSVSGNFDLDSVIYSHSISPIASHLLVACATQHPAVRLVDLQSGSSAHSLAGHKGAVLSVTWSPKDDHVLASAGVDGTVRLWDIRRSSGCIGMLDLEDSIGVGGSDGIGKQARRRDRGYAHVGAANGVVWSADGRYLVSAGHDERVRVWDMTTGANTLSHFGPSIKNTQLATLLPLLAPAEGGLLSERIMIYPNEREILMFDLLEGTLLKRLRVVNSVTSGQVSSTGGQRNTQNRISSLAWRAGSIEFYSAHTNGVIQAWKPHTSIDVELDKEEAQLFDENDEDEGRKRKRQELEDIFRDLTKQKITFT